MLLQRAVVKQAFLAIYGHLAHLGRLTVYVHLLKKKKKHLKGRQTHPVVVMDSGIRYTA